mmetsp:Transcript_60882/g.132069  ORF Transcript_60882/g.132069 Transcript_60882/m.132069 type:complete len:602 (-) Transcript_60882:47-1852(-)
MGAMSIPGCIPGLREPIPWRPLVRSVPRPPRLSTGRRPQTTPPVPVPMGQREQDLARQRPSTPAWPLPLPVQEREVNSTKPEKTSTPRRGRPAPRPLELEEVQYGDEDELLMELPPLEWAGTPKMQKTKEGNACCRITTAAPQWSLNLNLNLRPPRIMRTVEIEPADHPKSKETASKHRVITVSEHDLQRFGRDVGKLRECQVEMTRPASEPEKELGTPQMQLSFKSAFKMKCSAETELRDPWRGQANPEFTRAPSELDRFINQVWSPDLTVTDAWPARDRAGWAFDDDGGRLPLLRRLGERRHSIDGVRDVRRNFSGAELDGAPLVRASSTGGRPPSSTRRAWRSVSQATEDQNGEIHSVPEVFFLATPKKQRCAGRYDLVADEFPNGFPLWKQRGGEHWIFTGTNGRWYVGGVREKILKFQCSSGSIRSRHAHGSRTPHRPGVAWLVLDHGCWTEDPEILLGTQAPVQPPDTLQLVSSTGEEDWVGIYENFSEWANGYPLWKLVGGGRWLYSDNGRWYVGGPEKRERWFQSQTEGDDDVTFLRSEAHGGAWPDRSRGWERCEEAVWRSDSSIVVAAGPRPSRPREANELPFYLQDEQDR